ncbi:uncharacterized protein LOC143835169 isoform X2 [Paroedura picta]|uniref:uncharacterized protein LOC143835169 isoform X2 n=1 Tax=Paroedura picta TaxID=143630 RepID=UPI004057956F
MSGGRKLRFPWSTRVGETLHFRLQLCNTLDCKAEERRARVLPWLNIADCAAFDDRALIHSYNQAVHSFQKTLGKGTTPTECRSSNGSESDVERDEEEEKEEEGGKQWCLGDSCLAMWSGDGLLYPACITAVDHDRGCCTVRFDGYGNEEEQLLAALLPPGWRPPEDEDAVREWAVGDPCQATWSGDGLLYPATVRNMDAEAGTCCVEFDCYGNWESLALADLQLPVGCRKESSDTSQFPEGRDSKDKGQANARIPQPQKDEKPPLPPPPHGHDHEEALLSMLLAWHLSGYHTGYYMGLRQGRREESTAAPKKRPPRVSEHR